MPIFPQGPEKSHSTRPVFLSGCIKTNIQHREFFPISFKRLPPYGGLLLIQGSVWGFAKSPRWASAQPWEGEGPGKEQRWELGHRNSSVPQGLGSPSPLKTCTYCWTFHCFHSYFIHLCHPQLCGFWTETLQFCSRWRIPVLTAFPHLVTCSMEGATTISLRSLPSQAIVPLSYSMECELTCPQECGDSLDPEEWHSQFLDSTGGAGKALPLRINTNQVKHNAFLLELRIKIKKMREGEMREA